MATPQPGDPRSPILLRCRYSCKSDDAKRRAIQALEQVPSIRAELYMDVITFLVAGDPDQPLDLHITIIFRDEASFWKLPENDEIHEAGKVLSSPHVKKNIAGVGVGDITPGVRNAVRQMGGNCVPLVGYLDKVQLTRSRRAALRQDADPMACCLQLPGIAKYQWKIDQAIKIFKELQSNCPDRPEIKTCALYEAEEDLELLVITFDHQSLVSMIQTVSRTYLEKCRNLAPQTHLLLYGRKRGTLVGALEALEVPVKWCDLASGYAVHPSVMETLRSRTGPVGGGVENAVSRLPDNRVSSPSGDKRLGPPTPPIPPFPRARVEGSPRVPRSHGSVFDVARNPFTDTVEHFRFKKHSSYQTNEGTLYVSLHVVVRHLTLRGAVNDLEIPTDMMFGQLERLRSLQRNQALLNRLAGLALEARDPKDEAVGERFLEELHGMGFSMRANDKKVNIYGLDELIEEIEGAWGEVISETRSNLEASNCLPYRGLQEYFTIGSTVVGPGPGGVRVAFRVIDACFTTQRSLLGGRKFFFKLGLEFYTSVGREYARCSFLEDFEEWMGLRKTSELVYAVIDPEEQRALGRRGLDLAAIGNRAVFLQYKANTFFPYRQGTGNSGGSGVVKATGEGRAMIDNYRGLMLGYSLGTTYDSASIAIMGTLKAYRAVERATRDGETTSKREERLKAASLVLREHIGDETALLMWPALIAFSFTGKCWGYVLVDGLSEVTSSSEPWDKLVLPDSTKEMLLAMSEFWISGKCRQFQDVVSGKNAGQLFLLYGPPGTGKTLTVEALAERFQRPLYALSFGELGTNVGQLEDTITNVLQLCAEWNAFVLLDEGDALVEKRQPGQLLLNSLVGVLLRTLDRFEGQMFITSNRLASFDPAALNRVTLAIRYEALTPEGLKSIWKNVISRVGGANTDDFQWEKLAAHPMSGREINAVCRLGMALSIRRGVRFSQEVLEDALKIATEFRKDFPQEKI